MTLPNLDGHGESEGLSLRFTRRTALARFACLAGVGLSSDLLRAASAAALPLPGFTTGRKKVFSARVATYDRQPGSLVNSTGRDLVAEQARRYASADPSLRAFADALLDALDVAPSAGTFSELSVTQRRTALTAWWSSRDPRDRAMDVRRSGDALEPSDGSAA
jgi:hypothetical protein